MTTMAPCEPRAVYRTDPVSMQLRHMEHDARFRRRCVDIVPPEGYQFSPDGTCSTISSQEVDATMEALLLGDGSTAGSAELHRQWRLGKREMAGELRFGAHPVHLTGSEPSFAATDTFSSRAEIEAYLLGTDLAMGMFPTAVMSPQSRWGAAAMEAVDPTAAWLRDLQAQWTSTLRGDRRRRSDNLFDFGSHGSAFDLRACEEGLPQAVELPPQLQTPQPALPHVAMTSFMQIPPSIHDIHCAELRAVRKEENAQRRAIVQNMIEEWNAAILNVGNWLVPDQAAVCNAAAVREDRSPSPPPSTSTTTAARPPSFADVVVRPPEGRPRATRDARNGSSPPEAPRGDDPPARPQRDNPDARQRRAANPAPAPPRPNARGPSTPTPRVSSAGATASATPSATAKDRRDHKLKPQPPPREKIPRPDVPRGSKVEEPSKQLRQKEQQPGHRQQQRQQQTRRGQKERARPQLISANMFDAFATRVGDAADGESSKRSEVTPPAPSKKKADAAKGAAQAQPKARGRRRGMRERKDSDDELLDMEIKKIGAAVATVLASGSETAATPAPRAAQHSLATAVDEVESFARIITTLTDYVKTASSSSTLSQMLRRNGGNTSERAAPRTETWEARTLFISNAILAASWEAIHDIYGQWATLSQDIATTCCTVALLTTPSLVDSHKTLKDALLVSLQKLNRLYQALSRRASRNHPFIARVHVVELLGWMRVHTGLLSARVAGVIFQINAILSHVRAGDESVADRTESSIALLKMCPLLDERMSTLMIGHALTVTVTASLGLKGQSNEEATTTAAAMARNVKLHADAVSVMAYMLAAFATQLLVHRAESAPALIGVATGTCAKLPDAALDDTTLMRLLSTPEVAQLWRSVFTTTVTQSLACCAAIAGSCLEEGACVTVSALCNISAILATTWDATLRFFREQLAESSPDTNDRRNAAVMIKIAASALALPHTLATLWIGRIASEPQTLWVRHQQLLQTYLLVSHKLYTQLEELQIVLFEDGGGESDRALHALVATIANVNTVIGSFDARGPESEDKVETLLTAVAEHNLKACLQGHDAHHHAILFPGCKFFELLPFELFDVFLTNHAREVHDREHLESISARQTWALTFVNLAHNAKLTHRDDFTITDEEMSSKLAPWLFLDTVDVETYNIMQTLGAASSVDSTSAT